MENGPCISCVSLGDNFYCRQFKVTIKKWKQAIGVCGYFKEKQMSDKIEVQVTVNGERGTLADVSEETLIGMRNKSQPTVVPIKHGDYGRRLIHDGGSRFFFRDEESGDIKGYDKKGELVLDDANDHHMRGDYMVNGNIFKDMCDGKYNSQKDSQ